MQVTVNLNKRSADTVCTVYLSCDRAETLCGMCQLQLDYSSASYPDWNNAWTSPVNCPAQHEVVMDPVMDKQWIKPGHRANTCPCAGPLPHTILHTHTVFVCVCIPCSILLINTQYNIDCIHIPPFSPVKPLVFDGTF